ncbi:MAG: hypothetical protein WC349_01715 [Patescibacteria group bacterium]|jgi:hypothetical protein
MSYHSIEFEQTECLNCSKHSIPFKKDFKCPYCGCVINVYYDFVSEVVTAMINHKDMYGRFFPDAWFSGPVAEQIEGDIFNFFDELEERRLERTKESINKILDELEYDSEEYKKHFKEIVFAVNDQYEIELNKKKSAESLAKQITDSKTQPITKGVWKRAFLGIMIIAFFIFISVNTNEKEVVIDRDTALQEYWDEIKGSVTGTDTVDVCSEESNHCYSLDVDIQNGVVDTIYFPKGGHTEIGAELDSNGNASGFDYERRAWDITVDMNSQIIEDALMDWADNNNYKIE